MKKKTVIRVLAVAGSIGGILKGIEAYLNMTKDVPVFSVVASFVVPAAIVCLSVGVFYCALEASDLAKKLQAFGSALGTNYKELDTKIAVVESDQKNTQMALDRQAQWMTPGDYNGPQSYSLQQRIQQVVSDESVAKAIASAANLPVSEIQHTIKELQGRVADIEEAEKQRKLRAIQQGSKAIPPTGA